MKKYLLIANSETSNESKELGTIYAHNLNEAALYLAYNFPENYYLANIVSVPQSENESKDFMCIACSEYYASYNNGVVPNPVDVALKSLMMDLEYQNDAMSCS